MRKFELGDTSASVGVIREDGVFEILATFNNGSGFASHQRFYDYVQNFTNNLKRDMHSVVAFSRQDTPDSVFLV